MPKQVKSYQRKTSGGQVVTVKSYQRSNSDIAAAVLAAPGRPPTAAKPGNFANGRSIPNVWPKAEAPTVADPATDGKSPKSLEPDPALHDPKFAEDLISKILGSEPKKPVSDKTKKIVAAAASLSSSTVSL